MTNPKLREELGKAFAQTPHADVFHIEGASAKGFPTNGVIELPVMDGKNVSILKLRPRMSYVVPDLPFHTLQRRVYRRTTAPFEDADAEDLISGRSSSLKVGDVQLTSRANKIYAGDEQVIP